MLVDGLPGAEQVWKGNTSDGRKVTFWLGALVKREYYLNVAAVIVEGQEPTFLPGVKQLFVSMQPTPPKRNRPAERALVGLSWSENHYSEPGISTITPDATGSQYTFHENGHVRSFWYMSGEVGYTDFVSASIEDWGSYEVFGRDVYLYMPSGQIAGELVLEGGRPVSVRIGSRLHGLN